MYVLISCFEKGVLVKGNSSRKHIADALSRSRPGWANIKYSILHTNMYMYTYIYIYIYICLYIYMYTYIYIERERDR